MNLRSSLRMLTGCIWPATAAPTILMYHRVARVTRDPWNLAVSPDLFDEQMAYLRREHLPLPLDVMVDGLIAGHLPAKAIAVTFDDGYRDNLVHAKPILEKHRIPATLFLATGWVDSPSPFWWDELAEMILGSPVPVQLGVPSKAEPPLHLIWGEPEKLDLEETWKASQPPKTERQTNYLRVWRKLQRISAMERNSTMNSLRQVLSVSDADPLGMPMNAEEVREFTRGDGLSLGAHTTSHPALTSLSKGECQTEISQSQTACRRFTDRVISTFAYPYGDMNAEVRNAVAASGFYCACSTRASTVDPKSFDRFALPRIAACQESLHVFADKLRL